MLSLCWHDTVAYYAFDYAGIFDAGLLIIRSLLHKAYARSLPGSYISTFVLHAPLGHNVYLSISQVSTSS